MLTIGSLFSGIGGLELGLEMAGLGPVLWQVEKDPFCRRVLEKHWPAVERFEDVETVGVANLQPVDLICGGFPCQDISSAGKGAGLAGKRSGLWFEFARILGELRPAWVVVENVASGARRWVDQVMAGLEQLGYQALPFPLSAKDVGAPHLRRRVFVVAHSDREFLREQSWWGGWPRGQGTVESGGNGKARITPDTDSQGQRPVSVDAKVEGQQEVTSDEWQRVEMPEPSLRGMDDGIPNRVDRIKALGNAVVPQCAEVIGRVVRFLHEAQPEPCKEPGHEG